MASFDRNSLNKSSLTVLSLLSCKCRNLDSCVTVDTYASNKSRVSGSGSFRVFGLFGSFGPDGLKAKEGYDVVATFSPFESMSLDW